MTGETVYTLRQAASDLAADTLFAGCLLAEAQRWLQLGPGAEANLPGSFTSASLDSREICAGELFVALPGERVDGRNYVTEALAKGASALTRVWSDSTQDPLLTKAAPPTGCVLLSNDPRAALRSLAAHWRQRQSTAVTAVTGSNGKTTTKDFLAACLSGAGPTWATTGNWNNELGLPLTLLGLRPEHRYAAVELGASAVGEIANLAALARPRYGVITNAAEAHLAEFGSLDGVIQGKGELLAQLPSTGVAVLNAESPGFEQWCERAVCTVVSFGQESGDHRWWWHPGAEAGRGVVELDGQSWPVPLPGQHNGANLVAAILAARANGLSDTEIRGGLDSFVPSPHRGRIEQISGRWLLDDCYNANPASVASAAAALASLPGGGRKIAVLGYMAELGAESAGIHRGTGRRLKDHGVEFVLTVGPEAEPLAEGFAATGGEVQILDSHAAAAAWLAEHTLPGDAVLVKGSRAAAMEEVITQLKTLLVNPE